VLEPADINGTCPFYDDDEEAAICIKLSGPLIRRVEVMPEDDMQANAPHSRQPQPAPITPPPEAAIHAPIPSEDDEEWILDDREDPNIPPARVLPPPSPAAEDANRRVRQRTEDDHMDVEQDNPLGPNALMEDRPGGNGGMQGVVMMNRIPRFVHTWDT
jgi:hypothetical protein